MTDNNAHEETAVVPITTVSEAKALIVAEYPKLCGRFNVAFVGASDDELLLPVVDRILADVSGWVASFPDNFKTSSQAVSRPKFGLLYLLKHESVRASLGSPYCLQAIERIERAWDDVKRDHVVAKDEKPAPERQSGDANEASTTEDDAPPTSTEDDLRAEIELLKATNEFLATALIEQIRAHCEPVTANLFESLLKGGGRPLSALPALL